MTFRCIHRLVSLIRGYSWWPCVSWSAKRKHAVCVCVSQDGLPLNCNFVPLDIRLQNWDDLPPEFSHTGNRRHVSVCVCM